MSVTKLNILKILLANKYITTNVQVKRNKTDYLAKQKKLIK